jgi:hypothetical protein
VLRSLLGWLAAFFAPKPVPERRRNEPCHCGSERKYKRCCLEKDSARLRAERDAAATAAGNPLGGSAPVSERALHRASEYRHPKVKP